MPFFRKKPVVIEARRFDHCIVDQYVAAPIGRTALEQWCGGTIVLLTGGSRSIERAVLGIPTLEGTMEACLGDWIIRGVKGEFYPCKPDIFEATYEPAPEPSAVREEEPCREPAWVGDVAYYCVLAKGHDGSHSSVRAEGEKPALPTCRFCDDGNQAREAKHMTGLWHNWEDSPDYFERCKSDTGPAVSKIGDVLIERALLPPKPAEETK